MRVPCTPALAPTGMQFVLHMVTKRRYSIFMAISSTLTVLTGALLIWQYASGQWLSYVKTGPGPGFTLGSIVGIVVYLIGMFGVKPCAEKLAKIGEEIQAAVANQPLMIGPIPASPRTRAACLCPLLAASMSEYQAASSRVRPIRMGQVIRTGSHTA